MRRLSTGQTPVSGDFMEVRLGETIRKDCDWCGGKNTYTITRSLTGLVWNCFKLDCENKGADESLALTKVEAPKSIPIWSTPDSWKMVNTNQEALAYIASNNCVDAYYDCRVNIYYDPLFDRAVFTNQGVAVGRLLRGQGPKWYRYDKLKHGLHVTTRNSETRNKICVLVEDAASACSVSCIADAVALLGTNYLPYLNQHLKEYEKVVIALDPDAIEKALAICGELAFFTEVALWIIPDDLKYFSNKQIKKLAVEEKIL